MRRLPASGFGLQPLQAPTGPKSGAGSPEPAVNIPIGAELDLHSFAPADTASVVDEYIVAAAQAGFQVVRIIHGRGRGVQRGIIQAALDRHPNVEAFWDDSASHLGATIARLRQDQAAGAARR